MTLIELMVAAAIGVLALIAVGLLSIYALRSFAGLSNYMELDKNSRNTLDRVTQIIRESDGVLNWNQHLLVLSYRAKPLTIRYDAETKEVVMTDIEGNQRMLLDGCNYFDFQIFQRNNMGGAYEHYHATMNESAAKLVQISWGCSRSLIGGLINSESVQSAKIVIRKQ